MSTVQVEQNVQVVTESNIDSPFHRLELLLSKLDDGTVAAAKEEFGKELCVIGLVTALSTTCKHDVKSSYELSSMLENLGFTEEQLEREYFCVEPGCEYFDYLVQLINHLHVYHGISYPNIARCLTAISEDKRTPPKGLDKIAAMIRTGHMRRE